MLARVGRSKLGEWWWTVDRALVFALGGLMLVGIVLSLAASPAVAVRIGLDTFHFVNKQALFLVPALAVMFGVAMLSPRHIRRLALAVFIVALAAVAATLVVGVEIKGARRWLNLPGLGSVQPSEFLKPAFVVVVAWLFAESQRRPDMPANLLAVCLLGMTVSLLVMQPDIGQTILITVVWAALFFIAGMRWIWVGGLAGIGALGFWLLYMMHGHVRARIDKFLADDSNTQQNYQTMISIEAFERGGFFGRGPGEGTIKRVLPDSHTDFIFAVAAEEFGIVLCLIIVGLFGFVVLRGLWHAMRDEDPFIRFAAAGLSMLFGLQASINMAVNLHLIPAKGMTLPFVSYGGSSVVSLAYGMGMLIALTRRRPTAETLAAADRRHWEIEAVDGAPRRPKPPGRLAVALAALGRRSDAALGGLARRVAVLLLWPVRALARLTLCALAPVSGLVARVTGLMRRRPAGVA